jgi:hypothetical protein
MKGSLNSDGSEVRQPRGIKQRKHPSPLTKSPKYRESHQPARWNSNRNKQQEKQEMLFAQHTENIGYSQVCFS